MQQQPSHQAYGPNYHNPMPRRWWQQMRFIVPLAGATVFVLGIVAVVI